MNISFFILAGGYGLRAKPLSLFKPKPAFQLNAKPLIKLILNQLEDSVINKGYINLHYLPEELKKSVPKESNLEINYLFEENLSGSRVLSKAYNNTDDYTLIINGDVFLEIPINALLSKIKKIDADGVLLTRQDLDNNYPKLIIDGDKFVGKAEEFTQGKMYASVAIFKTKILKSFKDKSFFSSLKKNNFDIRVLDYNDIWLELGDPKSYYKSNFEYTKHIGRNNKNSISKSANISIDSKINNSIIWDRVKISGNSMILNSIILDDVHIDNLSIINKIVYLTDGKLTLVNL